MQVNLTTGRGSNGDAQGDRYAGIERVLGSGFGDILVGSAHADTLSGGAGADVLKGNAGADVLVGGLGDDLMAGGKDADVFAVPDVAAGVTGGFGHDTIADFQDGIDKISFVGSGAFAHVTQLDIAQDGDDTVITIVSGDTIRLTGVDATTISNADFII